MKQILLLSAIFVVMLEASAQQPANVTVQDDAKVGLIVTGTGNTINTTQIFGKSPEYAELKKRLDGLAAAISKKADECEQMRRDSLPARYCDNCRAELIALNAERDSVQKIETRFREDVIRLAETFSKIELNSERLRLAKQFFDEGKIREADAVLNRAEMEKETDYLLAREAETDSLLRVKANEWLIKVQVTQTRYNLPAWFDSTNYYFRQSLRCREMAENTFDFARFLQEHNQHDSAIVYYGVAAGKYLIEKDTANWLKIQNNLGNLYSDKNDFARAEAVHLKALEIRERLAKSNPAQFEPGLASTCMSLGSFYQKIQKMEESKKMHLRSLEIYERLAKSDSALFELYVARSSGNLGSFYADVYKMAESEKMYLRSLEIYEHLAKSSPAQFEPDLALTCMNLGTLYFQVEKVEESEKVLLRSLEIRERLAKSDPLQFEPDLALTCMNLGNLYLTVQKMEESGKMYLRSLDIYERLAADNPVQFESDLALTCLNFGILYQAIQKRVESEKMFLRALEIYERLSKTNSAPFELQLIGANGSLAYIYLFLQKFPESQAAAEKALSLDPTQNWVRTNLGHSHLLRGEYDKAKQIYEQYIAGEKDPAQAKAALLKDWDDLEAGDAIPKERMGDVEKARAWVKE